MKRISQCLALVALLMVGALGIAACSPGAGGGGEGSGAGSSAVTVSLKSIAFEPSDITVAVGGTVTFVNNDSVTHDIVGEGWDSGAIAPGASFSQTFDTAGTFQIHCSIHPSMTASITVK
jgi:plastocyanin